MDEHSIIENAPLDVQAELADLLEKVGAQRETFLAIIKCCREERRAADIDEFIAPILAYRRSVYTPDVMRSLLQTCGALTYLKSENLETEGSTQDGRDDEIQPKPVAKTDTCVDEDGNLVLSDKSEGSWLATPEAISFLDGLDPLADLMAVIDDDIYYCNIYLRILTFCSSGGRTASEIGKLVDEDPLLEKPRRLSGYFVGKLEDVGALIWKGRWITTPVGRAFIGEKEAGK